MKVTVTNFKYEYDLGLEIKSDKIELSFHPGEPEDASLYRDYSDVFKIIDLIKKAHEAGKNGEDLNIIEVAPEL